MERHDGISGDWDGVAWEVAFLRGQHISRGARGDL